MITLQLSEIELETICQALSQAGLENDELYKRLVSNIVSTPVHARVKVTHCASKLPFIKAIMDVTGMGIGVSKNIADRVIGGTLLLNESSISKEQWEQIAQSESSNIEWTYV